MVQWIKIGIVFLFIFSTISAQGISQDIVEERYYSSQVVLVTGFEPFDVYDINPSQLVAEALHNQTIQGMQIVGLVLPVDFAVVDNLLVQAIEQYQPVLIISLGLSPQATALEVESYAVNIKRYPTDMGWWSFPRIIDRDGPFLCKSLLNTRAIVRELKSHDIPSEQSFFAGTYLCNYVFYQNLRYVQKHNCSAPVGFIHVPLLDTQSSEGLKLETMVDGVKITIGMYSL